MKALQAGQKIEAIKHYREAISVSLAEAKSVIEEVQRRTLICRLNRSRV
jgi:ribosomal protein L7/L12